MIIALGGGSAMDEAKFIGVGALYDGDPWDFPLGKAVIEKTIPVITVVTIPATSSELNGTAVITNEALAEGWLRQPGHEAGGFYSGPGADLYHPDQADRLFRGGYCFPPAGALSGPHSALRSLSGSFLPGRHPFHYGLYGPPAEGSPRPGGQRPDDVAAAFAWNGFYDCGMGLPNSNIHILGHSLSNFYDTPTARHVRHNFGHDALLPKGARQEIRGFRQRGL